MRGCKNETKQNKPYNNRDCANCFRSDNNVQLLDSHPGIVSAGHDNISGI